MTESHGWVLMAGCPWLGVMAGSHDWVAWLSGMAKCHGWVQWLNTRWLATMLAMRAWNENMTWRHDSYAIALSYCTQSLHSVIALSHCTQSLHSVIALSYYTQSLHLVIALSHCTQSLHSVCHDDIMNSKHHDFVLELLLCICLSQTPFSCVDSIYYIVRSSNK
jgi:hypothetical protein